jgi:uncharacterized phage-associated protein
MARVLDVAKYILERQGRITTLKLQKLVYYAQVWAIAERGEPLFPDTIKAWGQGPVVPALFHEHRGLHGIEAANLAGDSAELSDAEREQIDRILAHYGGLPPAYLSKLSHHERPWSEARTSGERLGHKSPAISVGAIRDFYSTKTPEELEADYQMSVAHKLMDEHAQSLAYLVL